MAGALLLCERHRSKFMKILIYSHFFAPSTGGVETYVRLLAMGLAERARTKIGDEMTVIVVTQTASMRGFDAVFPFKVVRCPNWFELCRIIRASDVVHLAGPSLVPMIVALLLRKPLTIEQHGYQAACPNGSLLYEGKSVCPGYFLAGRYKQCLRCNGVVLGWKKSMKSLVLTFLRRWLCGYADVNLAISYHVMRRLDLPNARVVYYGVTDPKPSHTTGPSADPGRRVITTCCFAYVGRLVSEKGLHVLIEAARLLVDQGYDFRVKFVGDGPERTQLETLVSKSGLQEKVIFTGFLHGENLEQALSDAGALVMPSICEETAGLAAIEQMFRGRLVIASEIGGLAEVVGTAGMLFTPGNAEALAGCMKQVLEKPDIVFRFGQEARTRALSCFGLERMLDEHWAIYDRLH